MDRERAAISPSAPGPVTFTSRRGEIPITVLNRTGHPARVSVRLTSAKLTFPDGNPRAVDPLPVGGATLTFPALAEATGTFPLKVEVRSADGRVLLGEADVVVRSTAANVLALAVTVGAGLFLMAWYVRRWWLSRRRAA